MQYDRMEEARFLERKNRFIARVRLENGEEEIVHVKNTGRCRELLVPNARVFLSVSDNPLRKTRCDLVAVEKHCSFGPQIINMDSQAPNEAVEEWLLAGGVFPAGCTVRREVTHGDSRFDFYLEYGERKAFLEVKGVTLEENGIAAFPDAPTERGAKHIRELEQCLGNGFEAYILFVLQMKKIEALHPNDATDPRFGAALRKAAAAGVKVLAMDCIVTPDSMIIDKPVPVCLE